MIEESCDEIDRDFNLAIDRILQKCPSHPELVAKLKKGQTIRLNPMNVAKEAKRGRSTLYERTAILDRIKILEKGPLARLQAKLDGLNRTNKQLTEDRDRALDAAAAMIIRMRELEKETDRGKRRAARQDRSEAGNNVVAFRPPDDMGK
ncbi:hypothetical protein ASG43_14085 [Aureimonas sp. Leaf454]|uniref:hypothetical protein n=1 Tax=Aureimonas sp. Leaf454 TaxID=1736381 RepID=UPI0006FDB1AC|nr:hypothetical protein [Aureimonas sp. Leaf454]KQT44468.1 hypothetical protein ASG43_14085 [Aureimonas sp. Leaf454]